MQSVISLESDLLHIAVLRLNSETNEYQIGFRIFNLLYLLGGERFVLSEINIKVDEHLLLKY